MLRDGKRETGQIVTNHLWMPVGKQLSRLHVRVGEEVVFVACVTRYEKGYKGAREDVIAAPPSTDYRARAENRLKGRHPCS
jgi:hypothetical protein